MLISFYILNKFIQPKRGRENVILVKTEMFETLENKVLWVYLSNKFIQVFFWVLSIYKLWNDIKAKYTIEYNFSKIMLIEFFILNKFIQPRRGKENVILVKTEMFETLEKKVLWVYLSNKFIQLYCLILQSNFYNFGQNGNVWGFIR